MSSEATKGLSLPTFSPWGFLQPCQELWMLLNSRTLCKIQKMYSETPWLLTFHFGEFKGLTCLCRLCSCWTKAGEAALCSPQPGSPEFLVGGPFPGPVLGPPFSQRLLEPATLTEPHVGL